MDFNEERDDGVAVASVGPYENNLHLTPYRKPCHSPLSFYRLDALAATKPTVSKH